MTGTGGLFFDRSDTMSLWVRAISGVVTDLVTVVAFAGERPGLESAFPFALTSPALSLALIAPLRWAIVCALIVRLALTFGHRQHGSLYVRNQWGFIAVMRCLQSLWRLHPFYPFDD